MGLDASVSLASQAGLLVAALDLKLVRSVVGAIRAADAASAKDRGTVAPAPRIDPRPAAHPTPRVEPRSHVHPCPVIERRRHVHLRPREEFTPPVPCPCPAPADRGGFVLQPPWKVLPWQDRLPAPVRVKVVVVRPDIHHKGSLVDFFI